MLAVVSFTVLEPEWAGTAVEKEEPTCSIHGALPVSGVSKLLLVSTSTVGRLVNTRFGMS